MRGRACAAACRPRWRSAHPLARGWERRRMLGGRGASSHSPLEVAGHGLVLGRGEQGRGWWSLVLTSCLTRVAPCLTSSARLLFAMPPAG